MSDARHVLAIDLDALVQRTHERHVQSAAQDGERRDGVGTLAREPWAHDGCRVVGRKESLVVRKRDEIVAREQSVGGIAIDHVHTAGRQRLIFERGRERTHRAKAHAVRACQSNESIRASDEVGGESGHELRAGSREISECREMILRGGFVTHGDGIRVLEAERWQPADTVQLHEAARDVTKDALAARGVVQDRDEPGAGVLGIDVDGVRA